MLKKKSISPPDLNDTHNSVYMTDPDPSLGVPRQNFMEILSTGSVLFGRNTDPDPLTQITGLDP